MKNQITINDWKRFFPFPEPRAEQVTAIDFILNSFQNGKRFVIAELCTGIGKSAIGITVSRYLNANRQRFVKRFNSEGTWYLTTQKTLQEQYVSDFAKAPVHLKTIKSANNYQCQMFKTSSFSMTCAEIQRLMTSHKFFQNMYKSCTCNCVYRDEKERFIEASDSNTNYSYFLAESTYAKGIQPRDLIVLDEAHSIEDALSSFIEIMISERFARQRLDIKTFPKKQDDISTVFTWLRTKYHKALNKRISRVKSLLANGETDDKVQTLTALVKEYELLDKHVCKLNRFIEQFDQKNWIMNHEDATTKSSRKLIFKPIDVSSFSHEKLFDFGEFVLLMSATIIDHITFCQTLGMNINDVAHMYMASPFPITNRPIHILPVGSMAKNSIDKTLPNMAVVVKDILDQHVNDKGIIHCIEENEQVLLADNSQKKISEIKKFDQLKTLNEITHKIENDFVENVIDSGYKECVCIELENGIVLTCTDEHEIFTLNRGWVQAKHLSEFDEICTMNDIYMNAVSKAT